MGKEESDFLSLTISDAIPVFKIDCGGKAISVKSKKPLQLNEWHHIKIKKDKQSLSINVNGGRTIEVR